MPLVVVSLTVILLTVNREVFLPRAPFPATVRAPSWSEASRRPIDENFGIHRAAKLGRSVGPRSSREARGRGRDPLLHHRAIVGRDARTPWYIRVRSLTMLLLIVAGLGMAIAGITLLIIASGRFLLEILAG